MENYSVKATLSAVDSGFSSTLKKAMGATDSLGSKIKSGLGFGFLTGMGQQAFSAITSGISGLVSEIDSSNASWKTFQSNLEMLNWDGKEIDSAKKELQEFAQQTVYSSSDMATTFSQLAAVGVKDTTELVKGFGGLAAAAENPQQAMKTLSQQATQMAAKPQVAWADFKLMLEQTPAGIAAVAREMGMSTSELVTAVQDGKIKTEDFFAAIKKAGGSGTELAKLATEAKTIGQAMDGLKETVGNKLTPAFDMLSQIGIKAVEGITDKLGKLDGQAIADKLSGWIKKAKPLWDLFSKAALNVWTIISGVGKKISSAFSSLGGEIGGSAKSILDSIAKIDAKEMVAKISAGIDKAKPYFEMLKNIVSTVAGAIKKMIPYVQKFASAIGGFFLDNAGSISKIIPYVLGAVGAFKGFNLVKGIFGKASSGIGGAASSIGGSLAQVVKSIGAAVKNIGSGISTAFAGIGKGLQSTFTGLAQAIKAIGPAAQGMGKGLQSAFTGIGKALKLANPVNILALGAAIAIVAAGFTLLATQGEGVATILAGVGSVFQSIGTAIGTILAAAINAVANALLVLAPVLPVIAMSLSMLSPLVTAFGQAFALVAVAVGTAIAKIIEALTPIVEIIAGIFTKIAEIIGNTIVGIIEAIAPIVPAITEAFTKIATIISEAIVRIVEALAPYVPELTKMIEATSLAIQSICDAFMSLVEQISPIIDSITTLVKQLGDTICQLLEGASETISTIGDTICGIFDSIGGAVSKVIDSIAGVFESLGNAALNAGLGFEAFARGIKTITELNLLDMAASLTAVGKSVKSLVKSADGLAEIGEGMSELIDAFDGAAKASKEAGKAGGLGFITGLQTNLAKAPTVAKTATTAVIAALKSQQANAYTAGACISIGFANGMLSCLSTIESAAARMAKAAQKALEAKAKIASPSKVTTKDGQFWGQGLANGILDKVSAVRDAAEKLVSIPNIDAPNLSLAYAGEMSTDYDYYRQNEYTIEVPLAVDGKEFARATASYTQSALSENEKRNNRKYGIL